MDPTHTVQRCRWAVPTLDLPLPNWLDAWDKPWNCRSDAAPRALESTTECLTCPRWEARAELGPQWALAHLGL